MSVRHIYERLIQKEYIYSKHILIESSQNKNIYYYAPYETHSAINLTCRKIQTDSDRVY